MICVLVGLFLMVLITKYSKIQFLYKNKIAKVKYVFLKSIYFISE